MANTRSQWNYDRMTAYA